jgi:ribonuclease J
LAPGPAIVVDEVPAARLYKDGRLVIEAASPTVAERRRLAFSGIVSVALAIGKRGELASDPEVMLAGIPDAAADGDKMHEIAYDAVVDTFRSLPRGRRSDPEALAAAVRGAVRSAIAQRWGKKPVCHVQVLEV